MLVLNLPDLHVKMFVKYKIYVLVQTYVSVLLKSEPRSSSFQLKKPHHGSFVKQDMIDKLLDIDEVFVSAENFVNYTKSSALRTILTRHGTFSRT